MDTFPCFYVLVSYFLVNSECIIRALCMTLILAMVVLMIMIGINDMMWWRPLHTISITMDHGVRNHPHPHQKRHCHHQQNQ